MGSVEEAKRRIEEGFRHIAYNMDTLLFAELFRGIVRAKG